MPLLPEADPLDEQALITSLGGTVPLSPVMALDAKVKREKLEQLIADAAKKLKPQSSREVLDQVKTPDFKTTNARDLSGAPIVLPDEKAPPPDMKVTLGQGSLTPSAPPPPTGEMFTRPPELSVANRIPWAPGEEPSRQSGPHAPWAYTPVDKGLDLLKGLAGFGGDTTPGQAGEFLNAAVPILGAVTKGAQAVTRGIGEADEIASTLGKLLKPKKTPFAFAEVDDAAKARMAAMQPGEAFNMKSLPPAARPTAVHAAILKNDGITIQPATGQVIELGQPGPTMVGRFPNSSERTAAGIPIADFKPSDVRKFYETNRDVFAKDPEAFVGGWVDKTTNEVFLDVSKGFDTTRAATKFGELQNPGGVLRGGKPGKSTGVVRDPVTGKWPQAQKAVFEPEEMKELPIGNLHEFINSSEFQDRVHEMAEVGRTAMGGENPEWWDIVNGPMARVYGKENIEAVAGYLASTSPQNGPVANTKMMSELMRRHLKGEPVRQPNWRAPGTAMGKVDEQGNQVLIQSGKNKGDVAGEGFAPKAGAAFPNEGTYAPNAERVRSGAPETVVDDKVNDMFHALMGKLVGVFDRHWAKIAEKPEAGIYADTVQNRLAGSMTSGQVEAYPLVENAVRTAAKNANVDISKYSAWVWEGIRDTIRKTGKLYGQEHRASAIPDTTTGFNEIFEQLVAHKAKHLGVSVEKLESMLRSGDAELLAALLATPVGAAAYAKWNAGQQSTPKDGGT